MQNHQNQIQVENYIEPQKEDDNFELAKTGIPLKNGCYDTWTWSETNKSEAAVLGGVQNRTVYFHSNWSRGTAGVRGIRSLNNGRFYWELHIPHRIYGTSVMFGIGTKKARMHTWNHINMLGEDEHGWGLSHKGILWHKGIPYKYTSRFKENTPTVIGILFDGIEGTLTYYKDTECLGIAFRGLDKVKELIYPVVCSTAVETEMILKETRRDFVNLQDRCRAVIMKQIKDKSDVKELQLPSLIIDYLLEMYETKSIVLQPIENYDPRTIN